MRAPRILDPHPLTIQARVILALDRMNEATAGDLFDRTGRGKVAIGNVFNVAQKRGHVEFVCWRERPEGQAGRREKVYRLTERGRQFAENLHGTARNYLAHGGGA